MLTDKKLYLNNNYSIPVLGVGLWQITDYNHLKTAISTGLNNGYRHIDGALVYCNESMVGNILRELLDDKNNNNKLSREDVFITSKLWNSYHHDPSIGLEKSLKDLQLSYLDLYLIHWPVSFKHDDNYNSIMIDDMYLLEEFKLGELWEKMETFVEKKLVRSIGVSNFGIENLSLLLNVCNIKPAVLQIEIHPYYQQIELIEFCRKNDIIVEAYSPFGSSMLNIFKDETLINIAKKYDCNVSNVILNFLVSKNLVVLPRSKNEKHIIDNMKEINLSECDIKEIEKLDRNQKAVDPKEFGENRFK